MSLQSGTNMLNINMVPVKQKLKETDSRKLLRRFDSKWFWHLYEYFGTVVRPIFITISKETLQSRLKNVEIHLNRFQPDWRFM